MIPIGQPGRSYAKAKQNEEQNDEWYFENLQNQGLHEQKQLVVPLEPGREPWSRVTGSPVRFPDGWHCLLLHAGHWRSNPIVPHGCFMDEWHW